ncbi:MAG: YgfZ/GcvT domain-containing protein [Burkholderiales bacterium]
MNTVWLNHLQTQGAALSGAGVGHFGDPHAEMAAADAANGLYELSHYGLLQITGSDARSFLQSQLSNDVQPIKPDAVQLNGYCSAQGRMLANFRIWAHADAIIMQTYRELLPAIHKRLGMFVLRAKVKISDLSNEWIPFGISAPNLLEFVQLLGVELPTVGQSCTIEGGKLMRVSARRCQIVAAPQRAIFIWDEFKALAAPCGGWRWEWHDIRDGIPNLTLATQELFVPQMLNFELIGGVSFTKGCYPGQEIVARTQYLGKLKRRMYLAHLRCAEHPQPGDALFSADLPDQSTGTVVNAQDSPQGGYDVLAVAQIASAQNTTLRWKNLAGPALELMNLPYVVPSPEENKTRS